MANCLLLWTLLFVALPYKLGAMASTGIVDNLAYRSWLLQFGNSAVALGLSLPHVVLGTFAAFIGYSLGIFVSCLIVGKDRFSSFAFDLVFKGTKDGFLTKYTQGLIDLI